MSSEEQNRNWISFLLHRPVGVFTALLTIVVLGFISFRLIPIQLFPQGFTSQSISVYIPALDSNPYETLEKITRLVEEEIETIPGVLRVHSNSSAESGSVHVEFSGTANMDLAYAEIRDRMERVRPRLPNGVDRYFIWRFNADDSMPILAGGLLFDADSSEDHINYLADDVIRKRLESVDGVARVEIHGMLDQSVRILLDEDRCRAARVNLYELVTRLSKDDVAVPAGKLEEGGARFLLRVNNRSASLEEIRQIPVNDNLKIGDLGEVKYVQSVRSDLARVNGKFALFTNVSKNSGANAVDVCKRVNLAVTELEKRGDLAGFKFLKFWDQGQMIQGSLRNLGDSAIWGGIYAVIVLFLFLYKVRLTILVALSIPLSLLITLVYQYFTGDTFNVLSMMGMTLGVGMLVDNAIVVVENIYRLKQEGLAFRDAAVRGTREVCLAMTLSTLTSVIVFAPLMFMSEHKNLRTAFKAIGVPLSVSLLASLLVALIFIPTGIYHLQGERESRLDKFWQRIPSILPACVRWLQALLAWSLRHRLAASAMILLIWSSMAVPAGNIQKAAEGGDMGLHFHVELDLPRNMTLTNASDEMKLYEDHLEVKKKEYQFENLLSEFDRLRGELTLWYDKPIPVEDFRKITKKVEEDLPKRPGTKVGLRTHLGSEGGEQASAVTVILTGRDPQRLADLGHEVIRRLEAIPEISATRSELERGKEEVRVKLNREKTNLLSLSPEMVSGTVEWGLRGFNLPRYQSGDRELPFIIQYAHGADESLNELRDLKIFTPSQKEIPLAAIADFKMERGYGQIDRRDGKTILYVRGDTHEKDLSLLWPKVRASLATMEFPPGYGWYEEGGLQQWEENANDLFWAGLFGIVLIYLLMGVLFESAALPISVLFTIPPAFVGGYWLLYLTNTPLDMVGMIGFVVLTGVVVAHGILLVDQIQRLRHHEKMDRQAAIHKASADRFRPIMMTALTAIVGLLPLALAQTNPEDGIAYNTLAMTVIGGMAASTLFTVWVVPLFYTVIEDLSLALRSAFRLKTSRLQSAEAQPL